MKESDFYKIPKSNFSDLVRLPCSMIVDQNKQIENDDIGHACYNIAEFTDGIHFYCSDCKRKLISGNSNITKPSINSVEWLDTFCRNFPMDILVG